MYRFKDEVWASKYARKEPVGWHTSSEVVGQFSTPRDRMNYKDMPLPYEENFHGKRRYLPNPVETQVSDSLKWEKEEAEAQQTDAIPVAGISSFHVEQQCGRIVLRDRKYTSGKAHPGVRLKPLRRSRRSTSTNRVASPSGSEVTMTSSRSEGGERRWQFRYQTPWMSSRNERTITGMNPNHKMPGWK